MAYLLTDSDDPDAEEIELTGVTISRRAYDALMELCRLKNLPVQLMSEMLLANAIEKACEVARVQTMKSDPIRLGTRED